jgi:hypothetical protein
MNFLGWVKQARLGWVVVCAADTPGETMGLLLQWIRARSKPPVASAVRPAGVHPDGQDDAGGHGEGRGGPGASRGDRKSDHPR